MSFAIHEHDACRICGAADVPFFLDLGRAPFTDDFVAPEEAGREFRAPLRVAVCRACWTAQTRHDVDVSDYYRDYRYSLAASGFAQRFMGRLAEETLRRSLIKSANSARAKGLMTREWFVRADRPDASEIIGVDIWFDADGMQQVYADPGEMAVFADLFTARPQTSVWRKPEGQWVEW